MVVVLVILLIYVCLLCKKDKTDFFIFHLFMAVSGFFICRKFGDDFSNLIHHIIPVMSFISVIPFWKKHNKLILVSLLLCIGYMFFKRLFWNIDLLSNILLLKNSIFSVCTLLALYEYDNLNKISTHKLRRAFFAILALQVVLSIVQYVVPSIARFFFVVKDSDNAFVDMGELSSKVKDMTLLTGSMVSVAVLSGYLAFCNVILFMQNLLSDRKKSYWILLLLSLIAMLLTGIRTPFVIFVFFTACFLFFYKKQVFSAFALLGILSLVFIGSYAINVESGALGRMMEGYSQIADGTYLESSTFSLSVMMIPYFLENPIFGISLHSGPGYSLLFSTTLEDLSISDAYLMFLLCELGIIGVLLYLAPIFYSIKIVFKSYSKTYVYIVFAMCLAEAIVDQGIFSYNILIICLIGIYILPRISLQEG